MQKICIAHSPASAVVFVGSGKLGYPEAAVFAFALGADLINEGREAMTAIGCTAVSHESLPHRVASNAHGSCEA